MSLLGVIKRELEDEGISEIDKIMNILEDLLPDENNKKKTIDDLLRYAERIFQRKYGKDEVFVSFPITAKLRILLSQFRKKNNLNYKEYSKFIEWILQCSGDKMSVYDLISEKLYDRFKENYEDDKEIIKEKTILNKKRLFKI